MIHTTTEEVRIIVYLISFGVFCFSSYDTLFYFTKQLNKCFNILMQIIYSLLMIYITYEFSYKLAYGYIPIHFVLFFLVGLAIYHLIRKIYLEGLKIISETLNKIKKPVIKFIIFLVYPKEIIEIIKVPFRYMRDTIKQFFKKWNNKLSK